MLRRFAHGLWRVRYRLLAGLGLLVLAACQAADVPAGLMRTPPMPTVLTVQVSAALQNLTPMLDRCARQAGGLGLVILPVPAAADPAAQSAADLAILWGAPPRGTWVQTFVIGQEELVLAGAAQSAPPTLSLADLQALYHGVTQAAPAGLTPWGYPPGDDTQRIFEALLAGTAAGPQTAFIAPDPQAMRAALAQDPHAVGPLPRRWLDATVQARAVTGWDAVRARQPILAASRAEVTPSQNAWLACLQEQLREGASP